MARDFDGSTDRIDFSSPWNAYQSAISISVWYYTISTAEEVGYFWAVHQAGDTETAIYFRIFDYDRYQFGRTGATTLYRYSSHNSETGQWVNMIATHDGTFDDYHTIHIYENGIEVAYNGFKDGDTEVNPAGSWSIGGRIQDDTRNFEGRLCEPAVWNRVLSAGEITAISKGFSPLFFSSGLKFYAPLIRTAHDWISGAYGSLDGTTVIQHPPKIIYPRPAMPLLPTAGAPAATPALLAMLGVG